MKKLLSIIFLTITILGCSCDTTEPPKIEQNIELTEIDASVTETYLHVKINNPSPSHELILLRNGKEILRFTPLSPDTIVTDTALTELTSYSYKAELIENGSVVGESNTVVLKTLKPTSNNFNWTELQFNGDNSSIIYDLEYLNETEILAVGEFYFEGEARAYGFLHWNGTTLEPFRLFAYGPPSNWEINLRPTGILVFSENDIWFANGSVYHWDGETITPYWLSNFPGNPDPLFQEGQFARLIWGDKETYEIYVCGDKGALAGYRNGNWELFESNIEHNIIDISGYRNNRTGKNEVLCVTNSNSSNDNSILKITDFNNVSSVEWDKNIFIRTIWANQNSPIFVGGNKMYSNKFGNWNTLELISNSDPYRIRGTALNNVYTAGPLNDLLHFNGLDWTLVSLPGNNGNTFWRTIFIDGNRILLGGNSFNSGIKIIVGEIHGRQGPRVGGKIKSYPETKKGRITKPSLQKLIIHHSIN